MNLSNAQITAQARSMLNGAWKMPILASGIYFSIIFLLNLIPGLGWIASLIIGGPLWMGYCMVYLAFARTHQISISQLFDGFNFFLNPFLAYILMMVFIFLWSLLLIIPGIVAAFSYTMTFFILADNPDLKGLEAITRSKELMLGERWQFFCLCCRFIGWFLLGSLTLGIGFLWIMPYFQTCKTIFYEELLRNRAVVVPEASPQDPI